MILGTCVIDLFPDEKKEDIKVKLTDVFQNKFPFDVIKFVWIHEVQQENYVCSNSL